VKVGVFTSSRAVSLFKVSKDIADVLTQIGYQAEVIQSNYDINLLSEIDAGIVMMPVDVNLCAGYLFLCYRLQSLGKPAIYYGTIEGDVLNPVALEWVRREVKFIANSKYTAEKLRKVRYNVIDIIYHGIHTSFYDDAPKLGVDARVKAGYGSNRFLVGYIASGHRRKGHDYAVKVMRIVGMKDPSIKFMVISDNRAKEYYKDVKNVVFLNKFGELTEHSIKTFYGMIDLYSQFSLSEGFGMPVLEALACGRPVIHPNYNPLSEITSEETSFRVPVRERRSYKELAGILYDLNIYSPEEYAEILLQAKDEIRKRKDEFEILCKSRAKEFDCSNTYPKFKYWLENLKPEGYLVSKSLFISSSQK
jgi:glycosyltransferase involved in cell wall biosynthesis